MRKSLVVTLGLVCAGALFVACEQYEQDALPPPLPDETFACPDVLIPLDSIPVTVRAGRFGKQKGHIKVKAVEGKDSLFTDTLQVLHTGPDFSGSNDSMAVLWIDGARHPGPSEKGASGEKGPYNKQVSLARCTVHEGELIRIHIDGPNMGPGDAGPPSISVIGIYDRLASDSALVRQALKCKRCGLVEVCGTVPVCE